MVEYSYEYGQRWNAKLPRRDITYVVYKQHCGTSDKQVSDVIREKCEEAGIPPRMIPACIRYALIVHAKQRDLWLRCS